MTEHKLKTLAVAFGIFTLAHISAWFQMNSQFLWAWWKDKPIAAVVLFGIPTGLLFWLAWRMSYSCLESIWSARFIGFGASYLIFPVLTWLLLGETMFTTKTMLCVFLSFLIILIQIYY